MKLRKFIVMTTVTVSIYHFDGCFDKFNQNDYLGQYKPLEYMYVPGMEFKSSKRVALLIVTVLLLLKYCLICKNYGSYCTTMFSIQPVL